MLSIRLKSARTKLKLTQEELGKKVNTTKSTISNYENGHSTPSNDMLLLLADTLDTTTDYLLGRTEYPESAWNSKLPELTTKDERDVAIDLEKMINNLEPDGAYSQFGGQSIEEMDVEDRELLIASLENSMRLAKRLAKQKFTPKKYRD